MTTRDPVRPHESVTDDIASDADEIVGHSGSTTAFVALGSFAVGIAGVAGTLAVLKLYQFLSVAFITIGLMPVAILATPWRRSDRLRSVYGVTLTVLLIATGLYFQFLARPDRKTPAPTPVSHPTTPAPAPATVTFAQLNMSDVPYCTSFDGTIAAPAGFQLWLFEQQIGSGNKSMSMRRPTSPDRIGRSTTSMSVERPITVSSIR
jgi:hypothetical protein